MHRNTEPASKDGFTITQMVITLAIISVVSGFGVLGITTARAEFHCRPPPDCLPPTSRRPASTPSAGMLPPVKNHRSKLWSRHDSYAVTMDFGYGIIETRTFELESGLTFSTAAKKSLHSTGAAESQKRGCSRCSVNTLNAVFRLTFQVQATSLSASNTSRIN